MKSKYYLCVFFSFVLLFFCGKLDQTYTIEFKDGVKNIHNHAPLWGDTLKVALEFVQKIGELDTEDENYQLYKPCDIVRDFYENLYVLDRGNYRIQKYDKNGKYIMTIGREGEGPGEFSNPVRLQIDSEEKLYVGDTGCIMVFTNDGKEIKRIRLSTARSFHRTHAGYILTPTSRSKRVASENIAKDTRLICLYDSDGNFIKEFGELKDYNNREMTELGNEIELSIDINDNIYLTIEEQNRIEKYSPEGELIFRVDRPLNYKIGLDKEHSITLRNLFVPIFYKVSEGIEVDHKNRIWVLTYKKPGLGVRDEKAIDYLEFEIFKNEGILLGKLPIPKNFNEMRIFDDRLYLIDGIEKMAVYEYKIVEK